MLILSWVEFSNWKIEAVWKLERIELRRFEKLGRIETFENQMKSVEKIEADSNWNKRFETEWRGFNFPLLEQFRECNPKIGVQL
jgi:hypothetical protein